MKKSLPKCTDIYGPLLKVLYYQQLHGQAVSTTEVYGGLGDILNVSDEQRSYKMKDGRNHWANRVQSAKGVLVSKNLVENFKRGYWTLTQEGKEYFEKINRE